MCTGWDALLALSYALHRVFSSSLLNLKLKWDNLITCPWDKETLFREEYYRHKKGKVNFQLKVDLDKVHSQGFEPWTHWLRVSCSTNWAKSADVHFFFASAKVSFPFVLTKQSRSFFRETPHKASLFITRRPSSTTPIAPKAARRKEVCSEGKTANHREKWGIFWEESQKEWPQEDSDRRKRL